MVRKNVEKFIEQRDGYPATYEDIFLTDGASAGAAKILEVLIRDSNDAVRHKPAPSQPIQIIAVLTLSCTQGIGADTSISPLFCYHSPLGRNSAELLS